MKKNIKSIGLSLITSMILVGCGGGGSTDETTTTNTGYLVDSEVIGAEYHTSSGLSGTTDMYGRFNYNTGDEVTFSLGKLVLGTAQPDTNGIVTPKLLVVGDNTTPSAEQEKSITLLLQTLQSLDSDGDASNGIYISDKVIADLETLDDEVEFNSIDEEYLITLDGKSQLQKVVYVDNLDNKVKIVFSNMRYNGEIDSKRLECTAPQEYDILKG